MNADDRPVELEDEAALAAAYRRFGRVLAAKIVHVTGRRELAAEIVQEVFLKAWARGGSFPSQRDLFQWLYRCCHNASLDYLRSRAVRNEGSEIPAELATAQHRLGDEGLLIERQTIRAHLGELPETDAAVLVCRTIYEMTQQETADFLGIARKTVIRAEQRCAERLSAKENS